jgi:bifunctional DNA-binding transcriptional regulator/antitoxin component of YhaV-PrlF toxin-antitoxin module
MQQENLVKMSAKGQLVVPMDIRDSEKFRPGERFVAFPIRDGVIFKRLEIPKVRFETLAKEVQKEFSRKKISRRTVDEAVRWSRKS